MGFIKATGRTILSNPLFNLSHQFIVTIKDFGILLNLITLLVKLVKLRFTVTKIFNQRLVFVVVDLKLDPGACQF